MSDNLQKANAEDLADDRALQLARGGDAHRGGEADDVAGDELAAGKHHQARGDHRGETCTQSGRGLVDQRSTRIPDVCWEHFSTERAEWTKDTALDQALSEY